MSKEPCRYNGLYFNPYKGRVDSGVFKYIGVPYRQMWARKNIYYKYYCRNSECLRLVRKTWDKCRYCGMEIDWEGVKK